MILAAIFVLGFLALYVMAILVEGRERRWLKRLYNERVGLDLPALVALLPDKLRDEEFVAVEIAPLTPGFISVGITYKSEMNRDANPPNVGLVFDMQNGHLTKVVADGIALGVNKK